MSRFENMVAHILHWETGTPIGAMSCKPPEEQYAVAAKRGFAVVRGDRGGATMCGVTLATYEGYCRRKGYPRPTVERLKNLPYPQWSEILKTSFWDKCNADLITDFWVAAAIVDWVWISGAGIIKRIQRLLRVNDDGIIGSETLAAINLRDPRWLVNEITGVRKAHMRGIVAANPAQKKFLKGWLRRADSITYGSFRDEG